MHFFEYGKPDGVPLVFMLGTPHTGDSVAELSDLATEAGVRLICTTRPWYVDTATAPSFEICTAEVIRYLSAQGVNQAFVIGGSGGGPFALHLASTHPDIFCGCYLLAAMGDPDLFISTVKSTHTQTLLRLFAISDYDRALAQLADWGIPLALAHGVWADFKVLLGSWETIELATPVPVYIHHGEDDDNAPLESIRALAAKLSNCQVRISPSASHLALANDKELTEFRSIFTEVGRQRTGPS
jgi:pimeloyl-ACP methyl ester carboxylesterase